MEVSDLFSEDLLPLASFTGEIITILNNQQLKNTRYRIKNLTIDNWKIKMQIGKRAPIKCWSWSFGSLSTHKMTRYLLNFTWDIFASSVSERFKLNTVRCFYYQITQLLVKRNLLYEIIPIKNRRSKTHTGFRVFTCFHFSCFFFFVLICVSWFITIFHPFPWHQPCWVIGIT